MVAKKIDEPFDLRIDQETWDAWLRQDFATFARVMFNEVTPGVNLIWAPYLDLLASRLEDVVHGRRRNLIITLPPRHLKSYLASVALPAFFLGHNPGLEVMCISYGQDLSRKFAEDCQTLMLSARYRALFGDILGTRRQSPNALATREGGIRRATSLEGSATGVGADLMIFDDPQKAGESVSDAVRRASNQAFETTFLSRRNDPATCRIVIVMQRLHEDDFVGHVRGLGGEWEVVNLPAIAPEAEQYDFSTFLGDQVYYRRQGEPLHPTRVPLVELKQIRDTIGEAAWASQYMQSPAPAGGGVVKLEWFRRYTDADRPESFERVLQSWDTANTVKGGSDYSVCTTWGVKGKEVWLLNVYRQRLIYPDLKRQVVRQADIYGATIVLIEDCASGTQLHQDLPRDGFGLLRAVKPIKDKAIRMENQTAVIEGGHVHIPAQASWLDDYLYEFSVFPKGRYDDQVDSTSQALDGMSKWTRGEGLLEMYRQDAEATKAKGDEIVRIKGPPSVGIVTDIDGNIYRPHPDGLFHLPSRYVYGLLATPGFSRVQ
jgi:predicted phage terminase large subunit-like protein